MEEKNYDFNWVKEQLAFMEANPVHILSHMNIYTHYWFDAVHMALGYMGDQMDPSISEAERNELPPLGEDIIHQIKLGASLLPAIVYLEDNPVTDEIHKALCLLLYNLGLFLNDTEMIELYEANSLVWEQKNTIKHLIIVSESVMNQHNSCQISNQSKEPYQLSLEFLKALTSSAKEEDK